MRRLLACFFVIFIIEAKGEDTAWLSNSDVIRGKIQSLKDNKLKMKTEWGGRVAIDLRYVRALETQQLLWVRLKGENAFRLLKFQQHNNRTWLTDDEGNEYAMESSIELGSVQKNNPDKQKMLYSGDFSIHSQTERGDEQELYLGGSFNLRDLVNRHTIKWQSRQSRDDGTMDERENYIHYDYNRFWSHHWYTLGNSQWEYDNEKKPEEFISLGAGLGYQFWDTPNGLLEMDISLSHLWENYHTGQKDNHRFAATWTASYNKRLWKNVFLTHTSDLSRRFRGQNEWLYDFDLSIKLQLTDNMWFNVLHEFEYNSRPLADAYRSDYALSFGLGYSW